MPTRTAKFVSALFASLIAGASFITASHSAPAPDEAEKCLAGPKGTAPQGSHWYYRVERGTKRHCWYVGEEKGKVARTAPAISSASADPATSIPPPKNADTQKAIADARAELPSPQMQAAPETGITDQRAAAPAANAAGTDTNQSANASDTNPQSSAQSSLIASRWPESSGVSSSASPAPAPVTNESAAAQPDAAEAPAPAIAPVTLTAADSSTARQTGSIQTLLIVIIGALSLAGLIGSAIFRFSSMRSAGGRDLGGDRREIWDPVSPSPMAYASLDARMPAAAIPRETRSIPPETHLRPRETRLTPRETRMIPRETREETRAPDNPDQRISEMLARLSRAAAN